MGLHVLNLNTSYNVLMKGIDGRIELNGIFDSLSWSILSILNLFCFHVTIMEAWQSPAKWVAFYKILRHFTW